MPVACPLEAAPPPVSCGEAHSQQREPIAVHVVAALALPGGERNTWCLSKIG